MRGFDEVIIRLQVKPLKEGGYVATSADVPGLVAQGRTLQETMEIAQDVARKIAEVCVERGDPLPRAFRQRIHKGASIQIGVGLP